MKSKLHQRCLATAVASLASIAALSSSAVAQTLTKAVNTTNLNLAGSWVENIVPDSTYTLIWNNTLAGTNSSALGGNLSVLGLQVTNPGGAITVTYAAGNTLTIGSGGIDMSTATQNLNLLTGGSNNAVDLAIGANQTWNINSGRTLTLFSGSNTANQRLTGSANIEKTGGGTVLLSVGDSTSTGTALDNNGNDSFTGNWTITAGKVQAQRNATHAWGRGSITLNGGTIAQTNGSWTWSNNIIVSAASVIANDSSNGLGRTLKLVGDITSSNSSGLTFTNNIAGGTRTDSVGFILAGANASTYTTTTISANSRVRVGGNATASVAGDGLDAGNRGSLGTGDVTLSANTSELAFTRNDAHTVGNKISGSGTVVIGGNTSPLAGTSNQVVTLSGASDYTGATRVSRSRLNLTGSLTSAISVDNSGSISGNGSTTGLLTLASGSNIVLAGGGATTSITSNGATFGGANLVTFLTTPINLTVYDVFTYGAGAVTNIGNLSVPYRGTFANDVTNQKYTFTAGEYGATRTWNTTSGTWAVNSGTNFVEGDQKFFAADHVVFGNIASDAAVTLSGAILPGSVTVSNSANTYTFAGGSIGGATTLSKSGSGMLTLSVANGHSGGTTVSGGTLKLGHAGALGTGVATVSSGGTLDVAGFAATNAINLSGIGNGTNPALWNSATTFTSLAGTITLNADATIGHAATDASNSLVLGSLNLNGNKLSISAGSVYIAIQSIPSGNIDINNGGTLYSQNGGSLTSATGTIKINAGGKFETRDTNNTGMTTLHTIYLNGGQLGTATITNNNGGGGGTTLKNNIEVDAVNGGILNGNNTSFDQYLRLTGEISGSGALTLTGGKGIEFRGEAVNYTGTATANNGTVSFNPTGSQSFGGVIAGTRPLIKEGTGITTLLGASTYTGVTTIRGNNGTSGELRVSSINNGGVAGNLGKATNAAGNLVFGATGSSTGKLVYTGAGEDTDRLFTINGNTIIENNGGGALNFTNTGDLGKTSSILQSLTLGGTNGGSLAANIIKGAGASNVEVVKSGGGTWILSGTNTYTGATSVNNGTLMIDGNNSAATGAVTVSSGATLGGVGTIGGAIEVSGSIAPGSSIGTLNASSNVTWNGGNSWKFELSSDDNTSDRLAIGAVFTKGSGSTFIFDFMGSTPLWNTTYTLATFASSTGFAVGDFSSTNIGSGSYSTSYFTLNGTSLTWTAVPEPSTALGGLLLTAGLLRRRRRAEG